MTARQSKVREENDVLLALHAAMSNNIMVEWVSDAKPSRWYGQANSSPFWCHRKTCQWQYAKFLCHGHGLGRILLRNTGLQAVKRVGDHERKLLAKGNKGNRAKLAAIETPRTVVLMLRCQVGWPGSSLSIGYCLGDISCPPASEGSNGLNRWTQRRGWGPCPVGHPRRRPV